MGEAYGRLPLSFEANGGQTSPEVKFFSRGDGYGLYLTAHEAVLRLRSAERAGRNDRGDDSLAGHSGHQPLAHTRERGTNNLRPAIRNPQWSVLRMSLAGANERAGVEGLEEQPGKSNYFIGRDASRWRTNVASYTRVRYAGVYPGVDLEYYGNQRQLEYDFRVAPGASPDRIRFVFRGAKHVSVDAENGDLRIETEGGELRQHKPFVYQEIDGGRKEIEGHYAPLDAPKSKRRTPDSQLVGFEVAEYDRTQPLVIDPVLSYSTYLGGTSGETIESIAVDSFGNAYVTGFTTSTDFPTQNPLQPASGGSSDSFVTKLNATGTARLYSTYLGGIGNDEGSSIAVDANGNAYVTGDTQANDFPTTAGAFQPAFGGGTTDAYVTKLNPTGSALVYSTYLGGGVDETGFGLALDAAGNAYVTGNTTSTNFPTITGAFQPANSGAGDAFVTKLNAAGSALMYSTFLGGTNTEAGNDIAVDALGNAYLTGVTFSTDFPVQGAFQPASGGVNDAFVTKLNAAGTALVYSTYLGGGDREFGEGIALDASGNAYVAGATESTNFPTQNPFQAANAGSAGVSDVFVTKFNAAGSALVYSTYLGGNLQDSGTEVAVDSHGNAYIVGETVSPDFPVQDAFQATPPSGDDAFVTKLNAAGSALVYSTYLGGSSGSAATSVSLDPVGNAYVAGGTTSNNFPVTTGASQTAISGTQDAFVSRLTQSGSCAAPDFAASAGSPFGVDNSPDSVTAGDFNHDGNQDLAVANQASNDVSVLLGNGAGGFAAATNFNVGAGPLSVTVGDLNNDGNQDLAVANGNSNNVSILLGNGAGSFEAANNFGTANLPTSVAVGDFNHDGNQDLAVSSFNSNNVSVLIGNGTGGFAQINNFPVGAGSRSVAVGDFNLDGKQDLATVDSSNNASVLLGDGAGGFGAAANFAVGTTPFSVAVGDFNGDGKQDLAVSNFGSNNVSVLIGNGAGSFAAATNFAVANGPRSVVSGDLNGDGKQDLVTANDANNVSVLLGNGAGSFAAAINFGVGTTPLSVTLGDFNNDTRPDLATANFADNKVSVLLNSCGLPTSATATVTNTNDSGAGSLRQAILDANATSGVRETILFNIAGAGVHTISPTSALPDITDPVVVDGYTQPGAIPNTLATGDNASIQIELNGAGAGAGVDGLRFVANGSTVRGLVINRFSRDGISLNGSDNNIISGNFIGTDTTGTTDLGNGAVGVEGEFFSNAINNLIGGTTPAARNIISGNGGSGVEFTTSTGNAIRGNFIGLSADGTTSLGNSGSGVVSGSFTSGFLVGGDDAADGATDGVVNARNYISGNGGSGLFLGGSGFSGATVQGNFIGTDVTGTLARPNSNGIDTNIANNTVVGGTTAGAGNLISGNINQGISINNTGGFVIKGNRIGTKTDGVSALGNGANGIFFNAGPTNTQIGGTAAGEGNVIAFNGGDGVQIDAGTANAILSNSIHSNGTTANHLGIDLGTDGVTPNDAGDADTGANNLQNFPVLTSATTNSGNIEIHGNLNSTPSTQFRVEFFSSPTCDASGNGEGQTFLLSGNVTTDASGNAPINTTLNVNVPAGQFATATATDPNGNTSEFSQCLSFAPPSGPTLGNYANTVVQLGANATITPSAAPTGATRLTVSTSTDFKGKLAADPTTGIVRVTDAHPAGVYTLTLTAFDDGGLTTTKTFTLTVTTPATCNPVTFAPAANFGTGTQPVSVAVGDFNGDGKQDLAATDASGGFGAGDVAVVLGNGAGGFSSSTPFIVGTTPLSVVVGDFNGDGKQDLAVANGNSANVSVLLGNGAGSFSAPTNFGVGTAPISVAVGDFNGDGKQDLAAANRDSNNVSILLGDGAGSFSAATNFGVGTAPQSLAVGDFDDDGKQDLIAGNFNSNNVSVLLGDGAGSFAAATNFGVGLQPLSVAVGDFNGDGKQDLATANVGSGNVSVLLGNGTGSFGAATNFSVGSSNQSFSVAIGDFNGDGKQDLATANQNVDNVAVLLGDGGGGFGAPSNFNVGASPRSIAVGDFNGDGNQDLVTANQSSDNISILLRQCATTTFTWNGSVSADWFTGANWDAGTVPGATDTVIIPSTGVTNEPTISGADATVASVTVQAGRTLTIANRTLTATTLAVNAGAVLHVPFNQTGIVDAAVTNDGTFDGVNANSLIAFRGPSFINNGTVSVGFFRFLGTTQTLSGIGSFTSGTIEIINSATVTLASNHTLSTLTVSDGTFDQGASFNLAVGPVVVSSIGTWRNLGSGDLTLAGDFFNAGTAEFNGGAGGCGDADSILIRSSAAGTQRAWAGAGTFLLTDVDVKDQAGTAAVTVRSGTDSGNNGANWSFNGCAGASTTFTVTNTNDSGAGSLRQAILDANANAGADIIAFNITGTNVYTITPASVLPVINDPVVIDGYTQPGTSANTLPVGDNAVLLVELNGANLPPGSIGLNITGGASTVRGLAINRFTGEAISLSGGGGNQITGNFLGTNAAGTAALGNAFGVLTTAGSTGNLIGGTTPAARNVISGNTSNGVFLGDGGSVVQGNYVGTNATGNAALGNIGNGVRISSGSGNTVGGTVAGAGNVISGNAVRGVVLDGNATNNVVQGNFIGTNAAGTAAVKNGFDGLTIFAPASNNLVGGASAAARNVISGNDIAGLTIESPNSPNGPATGNVVQGNFIGVAADGTTPLGNTAGSQLGWGVVLVRLAQGNTIGGSGNGEGNLIAFNAGPGIAANNNTAINNRFLGNSIHSNGGLGIDFGSDGVTPNDAGDADTGANNLQNFPVLTSAVSNGATTVQGTLNSTANTTFRVEFFANPSCDASGNGEGAQFIGASTPVTNSGGNVSFSATLPVNLALGTVVTATATDAAGNTSEFSACRAVTAQTFSISGRVTDSNAQGLLGINLHLGGAQSADTTTDAAGNYSFTGLAQGSDFTVTPTETNFRFTPVRRTFNNLQADQTGIDFTGAFINHSITGRIVDQQGNGIAGVIVTLAGALSAVTHTDAQGNFSFPDVPTTGNFTITPEKEGVTFNPASRRITDIAADARFESVGTAQPAPTPTPDQSDDFSGPVPDPERWVIGILTNPPSAFDPLVQVFQRGGLLHIQPRAGVNGPSYSGLVSVRTLDLNSTPLVSAEVVQAAQGEGTQTIFGLGSDSNNWFRFAVQNSTDTTPGPTPTPTASPAPQLPTHAKGGPGKDVNGQTLLFELNLGGQKFSTGVPYDPAQHRFWRFRHDAPAHLIIFETSPDAANWTERFRATLAPDQTSLIAELSAGTFRPSPNPVEALFDNFLVSPSPRMQFTTSAFSARETDAAAHVQVIRTGSDESPVAVDFSTSDGTARAGSDYTPVSGTLVFGIGERVKTVNIPLLNDDLREGSETVNLDLRNPVGGRLGSITRAVLTILDDDTPSNPLDQTEFFVRQHYLDFLGREPDAAGLQFWTNNIESCGADAQCREVKRLDTSAAFFLSIEFQETGYVVHRFYRAAFGRPPTFDEYLPDLTVVREGVIIGEPGATARLELNKRLFAEQFVNRAAFKQRFDRLNEMQYVDTLAANAGVTLVEEERTALIVGLLTKRETRGGVLLKFIESEVFKQHEFNPAFVRMEYFGYLRRNPDDVGFNFWLDKLNSFGGDFRRAEMVKAFLSSTEYRARFGQP
jgi:hypothetical protein